MLSTPELWGKFFRTLDPKIQVLEEMNLLLAAQDRAIANRTIRSQPSIKRTP